MKEFLQNLGKLAVILGFGYLFFFIPIGERTGFNHLMHWLSSDDAKELGREAGEVADRVGDHLEEQVATHLMPDGGVPDGGVVGHLERRVGERIDDGIEAGVERGTSRLKREVRERTGIDLGMGAPRAIPE